MNAWESFLSGSLSDGQFLSFSSNGLPMVSGGVAPNGSMLSDSVLLPDVTTPEFDGILDEISQPVSMQQVVDDILSRSGSSDSSKGLDEYEQYDRILRKQSEAAEAAYARQRELNKEAMLFESQENKAQRDWQELMRLQTYPDLIESLKRAGLNPTLAFEGGSGFSMPTASGGFVGHSGQAPQASVSTENVSMEKLVLLTKSITDIINGVLGGVARVAGAMV